MCMDSRHRALLYCMVSPTGRRYIGVTNDLVYRLSLHRYGDGFIGRSIKKYGLGSHSVQVLAVGDAKYIFDLEKRAIENFGTLSPKGMNIAEGGQGAGRAATSLKHSYESRVKQSRTMKGRPCNATVESRAKQGESLRLAWQTKPSLLAERVRRTLNRKPPRPKKARGGGW